MPVLQIKFKCDKCKKIFNKNKLSGFTLLNTGINKERVFCSKCGKKIQNKIKRGNIIIV